MIKALLFNKNENKNIIDFPPKSGIKKKKITQNTQFEGIAIIHNLIIHSKFVKYLLDGIYIL